jgi:hypothetical protein
MAKAKRVAIYVRVSTTGQTGFSVRFMGRCSRSSHDHRSSFRLHRQHLPLTDGRGRLPQHGRPRRPRRRPLATRQIFRAQARRSSRPPVPATTVGGAIKSDHPRSVKPTTLATATARRVSATLRC